MRMTENLEILKLLGYLASRHPDLRFHQLLVKSGIIEHDIGGYICDDFYTESKVLKERVVRSMKNENGQVF